MSEDAPTNVGLPFENTDGRLDLKVGRRACFSSDSHQVAVELSGEIGRITHRQRVYTVDRQEAEAFLIQLFAILNRPEKPRGDRTTQVYRMRAEWEFGSDRGIRESETSQMGRRELEDIAGNPDLGPALRQKIEAALADGTHSWAQETFWIADELIERLPGPEI